MALHFATMAEYEKWRRRRLLTRLGPAGGPTGKTPAQQWEEGFNAPLSLGRIFGFSVIPETGRLSTFEYAACYQFDNVPIAQGTNLVNEGIACTFAGTITNIEILAPTDTWDPITWGCWDTDNVDLGTTVNFEFQQTSTKAALWSAGFQDALVVGQTYSIDVTSSVQEVINRPGWVSGNNLGVTTDVPVVNQLESDRQWSMGFGGLSLINTDVVLKITGI